MRHSGLFSVTENDCASSLTISPVFHLLYSKSILLKEKLASSKNFHYRFFFTYLNVENEWK